MATQPPTGPAVNPAHAAGARIAAPATAGRHRSTQAGLEGRWKTAPFARDGNLAKSCRHTAHGSGALATTYRTSADEGAPRQKHTQRRQRAAVDEQNVTREAGHAAVPRRYRRTVTGERLVRSVRAALDVQPQPNDRASRHQQDNQSQ